MWKSRVQPEMSLGDRQKREAIIGISNDLETEKGFYRTARLLVQKHTSICIWLCERVSKIFPLVSPRPDQSFVQLSFNLGK